MVQEFYSLDKIGASVLQTGRERQLCHPFRAREGSTCDSTDAQLSALAAPLSAATAQLVDV